MRNIFSTGVGLFLIVAVVLFPMASSPALGQEPAAEAPKGPSHPGEFPEVVAKVNGHTVSKAELLTQAALIRSQMRKVDGAAPKADLRFYRGVLDGLIGEVLIFDDGSKRGIQATEEDVNRAVEGLRKSHDSEEAFLAGLAEQGTNVVQLRDQLFRSLTLEKILRQELGSKSLVEESEARTFYEQNPERMTRPPQVRVRHILAQADKNDPESVRIARQFLGDLRRKVLAGADFGELAKQNSEDPATRESGGELPWVPITESESDQRLQALEVNQVSRIEETHRGFHLIQLLEKKPAALIPFEEVKDRITFMLETTRMRMGVQERIQALREEARIEVFI